MNFVKSLGKILILISLLLFTVIAIRHSINITTKDLVETPQLDLTIYTTQDIYYVKGLTLYFEVSRDSITFKSYKELGDFIELETSQDIIDCQNSFLNSNKKSNDSTNP